MRPSIADTLESIRAFSSEERRALLVSVLSDFVERDGRDATVRLFMASLFRPPTPMAESQSETLAAFAQLPKDVAAALLAPFDPESVRGEDCLSDDEVDRILRGS